MRFLPVFFFGLTTVLLQAQPKQNSPYSRFGIGDPVRQFFVGQGAMGGLTTAEHDPYHINMVNPAAVSSLRATAFETGLFAKRSDYKSASDQNTNWSGNLSYLALGITLKSPINEVLDRKKTPWQVGMAFGIQPYSLVGYSIQTKTYRPQLDTIINAFQGNGGTYRFNWSTGVKYKHTSFGLNLGRQFGKATYENTTQFVDTLFNNSLFLNNFREEQTIKGFVWKLGVQHDFVLAHAENDKTLPTKWVTVGLTGESNHKLNGVTNTLKIRSRGVDANGTYSLPDTLFTNLNVKEKVTLPATLSAGIQYVNNGKFKAGAEFTIEQWANYENPARPENLRNTFSVAAGMEYIPELLSYNKYTRRIRYRVGGYYKQDPRVINGDKINDVGLTFGFGLPLILPRQGTSFINTAFEIGQLGAGTAIKETYYRISVGFTLNDNSWFYKRRFE